MVDRPKLPDVDFADIEARALAHYATAPGAWTDDELEPAARALFEDVFQEDTWEDCPGLHDDVFSSVRVVISNLPVASLNATPGAQQSDNKENDHAG